MNFLRGFAQRALVVGSKENRPAFSQRSVSYFRSGKPQSPDKYTEVKKSYEEWKFVERLLPPLYVPEYPKDPHVNYPSGWTAPDPERYGKLSYFIRRTKNGMVPCYYQSKDRSQVKWTRVRYVEGNIWQLEKDIGNFLKSKYPAKLIVTWVDECCRFVHIKGDYEPDVKQWIVDQGF